MSKVSKTYTASGQPLKIVKDFYTGLWNVRYDDAGSCLKWAGPFKTRREAIEVCEQDTDYHPEAAPHG